MLVQRVVMPSSPLESWTVLGEDAAPVEPIERYLAYLTDIERSPNTVKAYAHDLKDWFSFLGVQSLDWREVRLEDVGEFVAWLLPPTARTGAVALLPSVEHHCGESTVNRKLSAVSAFYQHAARHGVDLGELLTIWQPAGHRSTAWKPFLHHVAKGHPKPRRAISLRTAKKLPRILTAAETQAILDACERLRDRLLFAVLFDSGMRIGEALGLRHEDWAVAERELSVVPRINANGARTKSATSRTIPVSAELIRLYADYMHIEYGDLDSDYVFVNLWAAPQGHAMTYAAVYDLVRRLRRKTGIDYDPHWYRHIFVTDAIMNGLPPHIAQVICGHKSIDTTIGYKAVYPAETIEAHRAFIARRRSTRPSEEYRTPTDEEWDAFLAHFEKRKVSIGTCARAFGTPCIHEHACVRCSLLRPDPSQRARLTEIRDNLIARIAEAEREGWLGEVESLRVSLVGAEEKLAQIDRRSQQRTVVGLGIPAIRSDGQ